MSTELVFILDKSGSMRGLEQDTIGGYNAMLEKQKAIVGESLITTVLFDNNYELLHDRIDIHAVSLITEKEYIIGGSTALLDAIGRTITKIDNAQKHTDNEGKAAKVLFVITTDGMENASREYDYGRVKAMVEHQKSKNGWEFLFLGANIDAINVAGHFGIAPDRAQRYHSDSEGTRLKYEVLGEVVANFKKNAAIPREWKEKIMVDFVQRGGDRNSRYREARDNYRPRDIRCLLIAESPPAQPERYFYFPSVPVADYLFLGVMGVLYPELRESYLMQGRPAHLKQLMLGQLQRDGFFLIDLFEEPADRAQIPNAEAVRDLILRTSGLISRSTPIIMLKANVYDLAAEPLSAAGLKVIPVRMPFPSHGHQAEFHVRFNEALMIAGFNVNADFRTT